MNYTCNCPNCVGENPNIPVQWTACGLNWSRNCKIPVAAINFLDDPFQYADAGWNPIPVRLLAPTLMKINGAVVVPDVMGTYNVVVAGASAPYTPGSGINFTGTGANVIQIDPAQNPNLYLHRDRQRFTAINAQTLFVLSGTHYTTSSDANIDVFRNGLLQDDSEYTYSAGQITFISPCVVNEKIVVITYYT